MSTQLEINKKYIKSLIRKGWVVKTLEGGEIELEFINREWTIRKQLKNWENENIREWVEREIKRLEISAELVKEAEKGRRGIVMGIYCIVGGIWEIGKEEIKFGGENGWVWEWIDRRDKEIIIISGLSELENQINAGGIEKIEGRGWVITKLGKVEDWVKEEVMKAVEEGVDPIKKLGLSCKGLGSEDVEGLIEACSLGSEQAEQLRLLVK